MILAAAIVTALIVVAVAVIVVSRVRARLRSRRSGIELVRAQAAVAEREMHDLTRAAFVAMAEAVEHRRHRSR